MNQTVTPTTVHEDDYVAEDVGTVAEFLARYYKPERYTGRGKEYAAGLLESYRQQVAEQGHTFISRHDSINGRATHFFGDS